MLSWFTESSVVPMVSGAVLAAVFLGFAIVSREKIMLYLAIGISVLTVATVVCEQLIVTPREEVVDCVYELAALVEANDVAGVVGYVSDSRADTIARVRGEMPNYEFRSCRVIGSDFFELTGEPPNQSAKIRFVVTYAVVPRRSSEAIPGQRAVTLDFKKESDGKWRIVDYSHSDPRSGLTP